LTASEGKCPDVVDLTESSIDLDVVGRPFTNHQTVVVHLDLDAAVPLGMEFADCDCLLRAFIKDIKVPFVGFRSVTSSQCKHRRAHVVEVHEAPVFSAADIIDVLSTLREQADTLPTVEVVLAPERLVDFDDHPAPSLTSSPLFKSKPTCRPLWKWFLHLSNLLTLMIALRPCTCFSWISDVLLEGESSASCGSLIRQAESAFVPREMALAIHRLQSSCVTEEERKLKSFARRNLQKLPNWPVWDAAFDSQLDGHHRDGTIGVPAEARC
jgi:hypothetical protein